MTPKGKPEITLNRWGGNADRRFADDAYNTMAEFQNCLNQVIDRIDKLEKCLPLEQSKATEMSPERQRDTNLSIESAARDNPQWDSYDEATKAAEAILQDCRDRRGIKHGFNDIDEDVLAEIIDSWVTIIRRLQGE